MIPTIGKFNINNTPHRFSYNPDDNFWYQVKRVDDFEPKAEPQIVDNFSFTVTLGSLDKTAEENEQDFQNFVAYHFGVENGCTDYTVTLSDFPMYKDLKILLEFWNFPELELMANTLEEGGSITRFCDRLSAVKFYAWVKKDNKVRFAIQKYKPVTGDYNKDFVFIYDVIVDKTQLITSIRNFIDEFYYKKITDSFNKYAQENNVEFTNPRKHEDLANILKYHYEEFTKELENEEDNITEGQTIKDLPDTYANESKDSSYNDIITQKNRNEADIEEGQTTTNDLPDTYAAESKDSSYNDIIAKKHENEPGIMDFVRKYTSKKTEDKTYELWTAKKFITATELENFLNELRPKVIGKPIEKISIVGNLFDYADLTRVTEFNGKYYSAAEWCGTDEEGMEILDYNSTCEIEPFEIHIPDGTVDEYVAELDEPAIIQIGEDIQFEVHFQEENLVQIGINTLKEGEFMSDINCSYEWRDISGYYAKNTIGHTIKDVYINKTDSASISWQVKRENGDDMYDEIGFILDNGYKLEMYGFVDYMELAETAPEK